MSTRCNILVTKTNNPNNGTHTFQMYHHHDGYPTGVGLELATFLVANRRETPSLQSSLDVERFMEKLPRAYAMEGYNQHLRGDIEYVYDLNFDDGVTLDVYYRGDFGDLSQWKFWPKRRLLQLGDHGHLIFLEIRAGMQ